MKRIIIISIAAIAILIVCVIINSSSTQESSPLETTTAAVIPVNIPATTTTTTKPAPPETIVSTTTAEIITLPATTSPPVITEPPTTTTLPPMTTTSSVTTTAKPEKPFPPNAEGIDIYGKYYKYVGDTLYIWQEPDGYIWKEWQWRESGNGSTTYTIFEFNWFAWNEQGPHLFYENPDGSVNLSKMRMPDGSIIPYDEYRELEKAFKEEYDRNNPEKAAYNQYAGFYTVSRNRVTGEFIVEASNGIPMTVEKLNKLFEVFGYEKIDVTGWR